MAETYKRVCGIDWPATMPDPLIGLTIGKKWRKLNEMGADIRDPWVPMLDAARSLLTEEYFRVSEWTEQHFHDFVMHDKLITWGCASSGKSLMLDEPVFYNDHVGRVGDVKVGDEIMSATGKPVKVRAVFRHFNRPLYLVKFLDGSETVCCDEHLWTVRYWGRTKWVGPRASRTAEYGWVTRTRSAEELARIKPGMLRRRKFSVPLTRPIEFEERKVPIDPYVLGCLLGDGSITGTVLLTSHPADSRLRDLVGGRLPDGYALKRVGSSDTSYMIVKKDGSRGRNAVVSALKDLGLFGRTSHDKFVPSAYKVNSVRVRRDVLAGLLDTDGTVSKSGEISFTSVSKELASDVRFLADTLGARTTMREKTSCGRNGSCCVSYTVRIHGLSLKDSEHLFRLPRKRSRLRQPTRSVGVRAIESVTPIKDRSNYPSETRCIALAERDSSGGEVNGLFPIGGCVVTHNSNDIALLLILDWMVDPFDTVTLLGSTTKQDLKSRSWEAIVRYHNALRHNPAGWVIPGKISKQGQALINIDEDDIASSAGEKAGIQGRDLNGDGRLQGAHAKHVRIVVDELAEINNHEAIKVAMANLRVGTESFKFIGLANPESWENPSCQYCIPPDGVNSVNVDTGCWMSTSGYFVRHHDGLKSPCIKDPSLEKKFSFLMTQAVVDETLRECGGNSDAPQFWKMIRGFPVPSGSAVPVVLDAKIAEQQHVADPAPFNPGDLVGTAAGIDPAWTEGGDGAYRARCYVRRDMFGRPYLDFTNGLQRLHIHATDGKPPVQQMREQVIARMREPYEAPFRNTAVDSSANQGLADDLLIYAGADCLHVNNSVRASEDPIRANDPRPAKETIYDRGTEAWCVLAEFCKSGAVRGLPAEALRALTSRRFAMKRAKGGQVIGTQFPLRLEDKGEFKKRFKHSPDECDACALAALAAKERMGFMPFGYVTPPNPDALVNTGLAKVGICVDLQDDFAASPGDGDDMWEPD